MTEIILKGKYKDKKKQKFKNKKNLKLLFYKYNFDCFNFK